jgi:hypothetical protein
MDSSREQTFAAVFRAFDEYVMARKRLAVALAQVGVRTPNVDPLANFAEVIVACEFDGAIQPPANKGFDVLTTAGQRIQVKTLRVSSDRPGDNGIGWLACTRCGGRRDDPLIDADQLALVVFVDFRPHTLVAFPITVQEKFPVVGVRDIFLAHIDKLLAGRYPLEEGQITIKRLR